MMNFGTSVTLERMSAFLKRGSCAVLNLAISALLAMTQIAAAESPPLSAVNCAVPPAWYVPDRVTDDLTYAEGASKVCYRHLSDAATPEPTRWISALDAHGYAIYGSNPNSSLWNSDVNTMSIPQDYFESAGYYASYEIDDLVDILEYRFYSAPLTDPTTQVLIGEIKRRADEVLYRASIVQYDEVRHEYRKGLCVRLNANYCPSPQGTPADLAGKNYCYYFVSASALAPIARFISVLKNFGLHATLGQTYYGKISDIIEKYWRSDFVQFGEYWSYKEFADQLYLGSQLPFPMNNNMLASVGTMYAYLGDYSNDPRYFERLRQMARFFLSTTKSSAIGARSYCTWTYGARTTREEDSEHAIAVVRWVTLLYERGIIDTETARRLTMTYQDRALTQVAGGYALTLGFFSPEVPATPKKLTDVCGYALPIFRRVQSPSFGNDFFNLCRTHFATNSQSLYCRAPQIAAPPARSSSPMFKKYVSHSYPRGTVPVGYHCESGSDCSSGYCKRGPLPEDRGGFCTSVAGACGWPGDPSSGKIGRDTVAYLSGYSTNGNDPLFVCRSDAPRSDRWFSLDAATFGPALSQNAMVAQASPRTYKVGHLCRSNSDCASNFCRAGPGAYLGVSSPQFCAAESNVCGFPGIDVTPRQIGTKVELFGTRYECRSDPVKIVQWVSIPSETCPTPP